MYIKAVVYSYQFTLQKSYGLIVLNLLYKQKLYAGIETFVTYTIA